MASNVYNRGRKEILKGNVPWETGTFKVLLVGPGYVPNKDHNYVSDVVASELSGGSGYIGGFAGSGRKTLTTLAVVQDDTNDLAEATASPTTWAAINAGTIGYAIVYKPVTSDADSFLLACIDLPDTTTNGTDIAVNWAVAASGGIIYI